jgi:hypothetical protein
MQREQHPVDRLFREALQEDQMQPSEASREQFLEEAATILAKRRRNRFRWFFAGTTLLVILGVAAGALILSMDKAGPTPSKITQSDKTTNQGSSDQSVKPIASPKKPGSQQTIPVNSHKEKTETAEKQTPNPKNSETSNRNKKESTKTDHSVPDNPQPLIEKSDDNWHPETKLTIENTQKKQQVVKKSTVEEPMKKLQETPEPIIENAENEKTKNIQPLDDEKKPAKKQWHDTKPWSWFLGLSYSPEWMFNTLEGTKYVNNMALEFGIRFRKYSIRTGLGISLTEGTNELLVEYNDYLGNYQRLDSLSFAWDNQHYYLIPTYYTTNTDVWDSLMQLDYPTVIKRYTYLQIPLILGYDMVQTKRFSLGFRVGPQLSILLNTKQLNNDYDPGKNRVIRINQITPDRIATNWQIIGGISAAFRISPLFAIEIEPNIRYYFNSVYEKGDGVKKPWSLGFRAAISINP